MPTEDIKDGLLREVCDSLRSLVRSAIRNPPPPFVDPETGLVSSRKATGVADKIEKITYLRSVADELLLFLLHHVLAATRLYIDIDPDLRSKACLDDETRSKCEEQYRRVISAIDEVLDVHLPVIGPGDWRPQS